jgi:lipoprotein-anchoring transpeptidase ErfK/SrfK
VRAFDISTGDAAHPTLVGRFTIEKKYAQIDLVGRDYYYHDVPYVMQILRPFYIHAAPWRSEFGTPVSRGCITLATADAAWLFDWTEVGTLVDIRW